MATRVPALIQLSDPRVAAQLVNSMTMAPIDIISIYQFCLGNVQGGAVAEWVRALAWTGDRTVSAGFESHLRKTLRRNFGNSVYPALPVSFGGDTKSRRSLLSGGYTRGSKRSHQSALECVIVVDSTTHSKPPKKNLAGLKIHEEWNF